MLHKWICGFPNTQIPLVFMLIFNTDTFTTQCETQMKRIQAAENDSVFIARCKNTWQTTSCMDLISNSIFIWNDSVKREGHQPKPKLTCLTHGQYWRSCTVFPLLRFKPTSFQFPIFQPLHHFQLDLFYSASPKHSTPQHRLNFTLRDFTRMARRMASGNRASQRTGGGQGWKRDLETPHCPNGILRTIKLERD